MPTSIPTPLDVAASIDRVLRRNIQWPLKNVVFADSPVTVTDLDRSTMCDALGGAMVVNLPDATLNKGMFFEIKKVDAGGNAVTVQCTVGGQTIDGAGAKVLVASNDFIVVESDGANYKIVALVLSTPGGGGAVFYTIKKIYKTDGVASLNPIPGTLIPFTVAVDGECYFASTGVFAGLSGLIATDLEIRVDGVKLVHSDFFAINGSGGDRTGPVTQEPCASKFLTAGPHTCELAAGQVNIALQASAADPLTLSVLFPAASFSTAAPTPKAATLVVHPVPGIGDFTTIEAALAAIGVLGGGYILAREGTYTPPAGGYPEPNVPVVLRGCGDATIIDLGAVGDPAFLFAFAQDYTLEDFRVIGTVANVNRRVASISAAATVHMNRLTGINLRQVAEVTGGVAAIIRPKACSFTLLNDPASWFVNANPATLVNAVDCSVLGAGDAGGIAGGPLVEMWGCTISAVNGVSVADDSSLLGSTFRGVAGETVTFGSRAKVAACHFIALLMDVSGDSVEFAACQFPGSAGQARCMDVTAPIAGPKITGCSFSGCITDHIRTAAIDTIIDACIFFDNGALVRAIDFLATAFRGIVGDSNFQFMTEAIRIATANCVVANNAGCKVVEVGAANVNRYANNTGFDPSTIIGAASLIEDENVLPPIGVDITLDEFMRTVPVDASAANRTITLPTAASAKWRKYIIKKVDVTANTVTIDAAGAETIDGALTFVLTVQYQAIEIQSDGTLWWIV